MRINIVFIFILLIVFGCGGAIDFSSTELALGEKKYKIFCVACHGLDGKLAINGAKDLSKYRGSLKRKVKIITNGKGLMTPFKDILTSAEIEAIAKYTVQLRKNK